MPEDKLTREDRKSQRQLKRLERKDEKDINLGLDVDKELYNQGIDPFHTKTPLTEQRKKEINQGLLTGEAEDIVKKVQGFSDAYSTPDYTQPVKPDREALKKSLKREKTARIWDAIGNFGTRLAGKEVDPSKSFASQLSQERQAQYQQYKDVSRANKARAQEWENNYRNDLLKYLDSIKDEKNANYIESLKKKLYSEQQKASGSAKFTPVADDMYLKGSNPFTTRLAALTDDVEALLPPLGKDKRYSPSDKESQAKEIIMQMYDIKTDPKGNQYLVPKHGMENYIDTLWKQRDRERQVVPIEKQLKLLKMELADMGDEGTSGIEFIDRPKRLKLEQQIADLEQQKKDILGESKPTPIPTPNTQKDTTGSRVNPLKNMYESL